MHAVWLQTAWCHSSFTAGGLGEIWFLSFRNHVLEKSDRCGSEHYGLYPGVSIVGGGRRVAECIEPYWPPGTPGHSIQIVDRKPKEICPILDTVFILQRMRNRIKQILQKHEASASCASKQNGISLPHSAALLPRDKQRKSLDPFRWDTELLYSRVIWERLVMLAENSHDNEVYWKTLIGLSIQHHSHLTWSY